MRKKALLALVLVALLLFIPAACKRKLPLAVNDGDTVYYTPKGKSYHSTEECPTLSRSKILWKAPLDTAARKPRADACDICVKQK